MFIMVSKGTPDEENKLTERHILLSIGRLVACVNSGPTIYLERILALNLASNDGIL
jgi:hypothetical protein